MRESKRRALARAANYSRECDYELERIASARQIGEYIAVLWRGRIVEAGDAEKMFSSDNPFVHQFLRGDAEGPLTMD